MKAFRFRADALLHLRRRHRDAVHRELAQAERAVFEATAAVRDADTRIDDASATSARAMAAGGLIVEFERHRNWIAHLRASRARLQASLDERTAVAAAVRSRLHAAHQRVRVLERLRDRASARYEQAVRRQEMKELDEFAVLRFARRATEGETTHGS